LLYAHAFDWLYTTGAAGSGAQLLQRYALVARLAPEVRHGVAHVRATHRIGVGTAVTCGDLPDLRSMTMPLIEELDLEVETLDSTEGLEATGPARHERFAELAPAIRLACAAAVPDADARRDVPKRWMAAAAVAALLVTAAGSATYWSASGPDLVAPRSPVPKGPQPVERLSVGPGTASAVAVQPQAPGGSIPPQAEPAPADKQGTPPATVASPVPAHRTGGTGGTPAAPRASAEPLPRVDSVLIDGNRRLAIVGGAILGVGDGVGHRTIARIERSGIVLRDRSGLEVAVPLASFRAIK
jgi:hypothetical protein